MKNRFGTLCMAVPALCIALAGCGGGASSDLASFHAPSGWRAVNVFGMSMFIAPDSKSGNGQVLMLMRLPHGSNDFSTATGRYQHAKIEARKTITICGNQPAQYVELTGDQAGKHDQVQMVTTKYGDTAYMAMYARGAGEPVNSDAAAAIKALCLKK
ncbi:MAG: hypothetical protein M3R35_01870 [Candidatus Eremiobacteraeota bacterium]|nr:hypothetical protein [Candidatus Eremiobacteraeota bacterium]